MARLHRRGLGFILVHGAGSFGHFEARHHAVSAGDASPIGMSATHAAVVKLNGLVVDALLKRGVPAVGVSPLLVPAKVRNDFVAALLDRGHLPVLHGDTCYAADGRTAILSGDALIATMASAFQFVNRIVFLSDVPGLLSRPPPCSNPPPEDLIKRITVNEAGDLHFDADLSTSTLEHDVTGGIAAKVMAAAKCVADGHGRITAFIAGVATEGAEHALMARPDRWGGASCTRITYQVQGVSTQEPYPQFDDAPSGRRRSWLFG